jgi:hypothetical protein
MVKSQQIKASLYILRKELKFDLRDQILVWTNRQTTPTKNYHSQFN